MPSACSTEEKISENGSLAERDLADVKSSLVNESETHQNSSSDSEVRTLPAAAPAAAPAGLGGSSRRGAHSPSVFDLINTDLLVHIMNAHTLCWGTFYCVFNAIRVCLFHCLSPRRSDGLPRGAPPKVSETKREKERCRKVGWGGAEEVRNRQRDSERQGDRQRKMMGWTARKR